MSPGFQTQGVGRSLVNKVLTDWPERRIEVVVRNTAIGFWERLGFKPFGNWMDHESFTKHGIRFHPYSIN